MSRYKITSYVTPDIAQMLKRVRAIEGRSISDIVEDAVVQNLMGADRGAQHAAILASLGKVNRRLAAIERSLDTLFELSAQSTLFLLSVTPEVPDADRASWSARGRERLTNMMSLVIKRLAEGRSTMKDAWTPPGPGAAPTSPVRRGDAQ